MMKPERKVDEAMVNFPECIPEIEKSNDH